MQLLKLRMLLLALSAMRSILLNGSKTLEMRDQQQQHPRTKPKNTLGHDGRVKAITRSCP